MIDVQGAARTIHYSAYGIQTVRSEQGTVALIFMTPDSTAHVFEMPESEAKKIEDGLAAARTGVAIAAEIPRANGNGAPHG